MSRRVLLWVTRHGSTTDSQKNIFRGQRDLPLDEKGFSDAHALKDFFEGKPWHKIFCSDLKRGMQTALVIAGDRDADINVCPILRPWRIGYLTGKDKTAYGKDMNVFIKNADMTPQDGESRNDFEKGRVIPAFVELIEMGLDHEPSIEVGHSSLIHALSHLLYGEGKKSKPLSVEPGGAVEVYLEDGEIKAEVVFKPGKDDSSFSTATS